MIAVQSVEVFLLIGFPVASVVCFYSAADYATTAFAVA